MVNGLANKTKNLDNGFFDGWAGAALGGALSGGMASSMAGAVSSHLPSANLDLSGGFSVGLSPSFAFGAQGLSFGANGSLNYERGNFAYGVSGGGSYGKSGITGHKGLTYRLGGGVSYFDGNTFASLSTIQYYGDNPQRTGTVGLGGMKNRVFYENDSHPGLTKAGLSDNGDRYRTAALVFQSGQFSAGFNLFTGDPGPSGRREFKEIDGRDTYIANNGFDPNKYRFGGLFLGYGSTRVGVNSEVVRHVIQNIIAHDLFTLKNSKWFERLPSRYPTKIYGGFYKTNIYSLWE